MEPVEYHLIFSIGLTSLHAGAASPSLRLNSQGSEIKE